MSKAQYLLAYVPVLHQGYVEFFKKHPTADIIIFGRSLIAKFDWLHRKDIRAVDPEVMMRACRAILPGRRVFVIEVAGLEVIRKENCLFVFANEEESRQIAAEFFGGCDVKFDDVFLRWDKPRVLDQKNAEGFPVTSEEIHRKFISEADLASVRSSDWWVHVGAILVVNDYRVIGFNKHVPSEHMPYVLGDPRSLFKKGVAVELTTAQHAEGAVIGKAACYGISTLGGKLYVTNFPCPFCANFLAYTGLAEIYFRTGYSMLEGAELLRKKGIKLFQVV